MALTFQAISLDRLHVGTFCDAAWGVRPDGSSQGGYLIFFADRALLEGKNALMKILDWRSWKLKRVCRSSLAAETQAFTDAIDQLNWLRLFLADILAPKALDLRKVEELLQSLPNKPCNYRLQESVR